MNTSINNKLINNNRNIYLPIGIIILLLLIVGSTYAYTILSASVTNGNYSADTSCFTIDYDVTNDDGTLPITGTMFPSSSPSGGLSGKVSMKLNDICNVNGTGTGTLTLNVTSASATLIQKVVNHCENSQTLKTMIDYTTSSTCTAQTNGQWVTNGTALKYAVYDTNNVTSSTIPLSVGYVNKTGSIDLYSDFALSETAVTYYVYIWLDGNISDNSYAGLSFDGNVSASGTQIED